MIDPAHARLSISAQCRMLSISRSSFYYAPVPETGETLALMHVIDAAFLDMPWYGRRQMVRHLRRNGHDVGRRRVRRLMRKMGLSPIYQRPRTSDPHPKHQVYHSSMDAGHRSAASSEAASAVAGEKGFDYQFTLVKPAIQTAVNTTGDLGRLARGEDTKRFTRNALETAGYFTGFVLGQMASTTQFLVDVGQGDVDPQTLAEWYEGLTKARSAKTRGSSYRDSAQSPRVRGPPDGFSLMRHNAIGAISLSHQPPHMMG